MPVTGNVNFLPTESAGQPLIVNNQPMHAW
jgi:hypothetical protein